MSRRSGCQVFCVLILMLLVFGGGCSRAEKESVAGEEGAANGIQLTSPAFKGGEFIPEKYTCDAENMSPPLEWSNLPEGTRSIVIICDDPDAPRGTWIHWVLFDIPGTATGLDEGVRAMVNPPTGGTHGLNDFKKMSYGGPCPPEGSSHRYYFKIYALDARLDFKGGVAKKTIVRAMDGHLLGEGRLMGKYKR